MPQVFFGICGLILGTFFLGCAKKTTPVQIEETVRHPIKEGVVETSSIVESISLQKALSGHDALPCSSLSFVDQTPWLELNDIVENVSKPPWAGMRAASCMIELYPKESSALFLDWIVDEKKKGLAYLLASNIDSLPVEQALALVAAALKGPCQEGCKIRFQKSQNESILKMIQ